MQMPCTVMFIAVVLGAPWQARGDSIDGRVLQVQLPAQDVTLLYIEARAVFTVQLKTKTASVEG